MRVVFPASVLLLLLVVLGWLGRDPAHPSRLGRSLPRTTDSLPARAETSPLQGLSLEGLPADVPPRRVATAADRDALVALGEGVQAAWEVQLGLIEGTPGLTDPSWLRLIAADDTLYRAWLGIYLSFDGPAVDALDLDILGQLAEAFGRYRAQPGPDARLLDMLGEIEGRLRATAALHLPIQLAEEMLPRWIAYLGSGEEGRAPTASENLLFQECARLVRDHLEGPRSRFPPLLALRARVLERLGSVPGDWSASGAAAHEEPWSRWRGDLGRLLWVASSPLDEGLLQQIHSACPILAVAARVPERDLDRVLMRGVALQDLATDGAMDRVKVNGVAREHVDRFLTFLSLLEVETAYGRQRPFASGPETSGARIYLLVSALHARSSLPRGTGTDPTWLAGQSDDRVAEELARRHPELAKAREAAWECLAGELQGLVSGALR